MQHLFIRRLMLVLAVLMLAAIAVFAWMRAGSAQGRIDPALRQREAARGWGQYHFAWNIAGTVGVFLEGSIARVGALP